jgi:hypothetical protein
MSKVALSAIGLLLVAIGLALARHSSSAVSQRVASLPQAAATSGERPAPDAPVTQLAAAVESEVAPPYPHPVTPAHVRNFREVDLLQGAWKALERRDFARARELVSAHRNDYPGQWDDMNEGLEILAECLQRRTPEIVERARVFHRQRTASMMRKRIRRFCLSPV